MSMMRYSRDTLFKQLGLATIVIVLIGGGFAAMPSYGQAQTSTSTVRVPFDNVSFHVCIGEVVQSSGYAELVFHTTVNPDGTKSVNVGHVNVEGLKGTTESGDPVVYSEVAHSVANERGSGGVFHINVHITLAAQGQPNLLFHLVVNTIINDDGTTKHDVSHASLRCVGEG
jgi:hypothetical protein